MTLRAPPLNPFLRLGAAGCAVFWMVCVTLCDAEHLFEFGRHGTGPIDNHSLRQEAAALEEHGNPGHDLGESHRSTDAESHSHGSDHHDGEGDSCCSALKVIVHAAKPVIINKPVFHSSSVLCALLQGRESLLADFEKMPEHPPPKRKWVFTPEVYLGPAFRSHAPPLFV